MYDNRSNMFRMLISGLDKATQQTLSIMYARERSYELMNKQRELIYKQRQDVLFGMDISDKIVNMIAQTIEQKVAEFYDVDAKTYDIKALESYCLPLLREQYPVAELKKIVSSKVSENDVAKITEILCERANNVYKEKEEMFGAENMREIERAVLLRNVDRKWMDHIDAMDDLKGSVGLQGYAQRDPVNEYRFRGADMFDELVSDIRENTARMILCLAKKAPDIQRVQIANPIMESASGEIAKKLNAAAKGAIVGRNDPCPCGSGKKYKNCCGANR